MHVAVPVDRNHVLRSVNRHVHRHPLWIGGLAGTETVVLSTEQPLAEGDKVSVPNFGTFMLSERPERQGRNPATGEPITIRASKSVRFKVSKNLKEQL